MRAVVGFLVFVCYPITEIILIAWVASLIGWGPTILVLMLGFVIGVALMRMAGTAAFRALTGASRRGWAQTDPETGETVIIHPVAEYDGTATRQAGRDLRKSGLLFVGGALIAAPGFLNDIPGMLLVLPPTRSVIANRLSRRVRPGAIRGQTVVMDGSGIHVATWGTDESSGSRAPGPRPETIAGEILPPRDPIPDSRKEPPTGPIV